MAGLRWHDWLLSVGQNGCFYSSANTAVVDRLVYTDRLVEFNGASYRMENALMLGKGEAE